MPHPFVLTRASHMLPRNMLDLTATMRKALHFPSSHSFSMCITPALIHALLVRRMLGSIIVVWDIDHRDDAAYAHYSVHVPTSYFDWVKEHVLARPIGPPGPQSKLVRTC